MLKNYIQKYKLQLWQFGFLMLGSTWLLAPILNDRLSARSTLISEYETDLEPFSWLFRSADVLSALLLIAAVIYIRHRTKIRLGRLYPLLIIVGLLMMLDPAVTTNCVIRVHQCIETPNLSFYIHAAETVTLSLLLFGMSVRDGLVRKNLVSTVFVVFQLLYLLFGVSQLADRYNISTVSQYGYQYMVIVWLAWYIGSLAPRPALLTDQSKRLARRMFAAWAYFNGIAAILLSLVHIRLYGVFRDVYFASDTAWLAQHSVIVGLVLLYISRHLLRGEHRARQIFLVVLFMEIIKYAAITPQFFLLTLYSLTFAALFTLRPYFTRGNAGLPWHSRFQEAGMIVAGVLGAGLIAAVPLSTNQHYFVIIREAFEHLGGYVFEYRKVPHAFMQSSLIAHTVSVLIVTTLGFVLWSLFQPARLTKRVVTSAESDKVRNLLQQAATSSEDYFKYWPHDKEYYWSGDGTAFIAYRVTKSVVFALADPISLSSDGRATLLHSFVSDWSSRGFRVCFLLVAEESCEMYQSVGLNKVLIGANAVVSNDKFVSQTLRDKWWRWKMNRATKAGYTYERTSPPHSHDLLSHMEQVSDKWLERPGHREQGFVLGNFDHVYLQECTLHYLRDSSGRIVAFANELPIFHGGNQATVDLMRFIPEADDTMPFLMANIIRNLQLDHTYDYFDLGFVPLANMEGRIAKIAKTAGSLRFSAKGLEQFKNKFDPQWHKCYLMHDGDIADLAVIALSLEEVMKP